MSNAPDSVGAEPAPTTAAVETPTAPAAGAFPPPPPLGDVAEPYRPLSMVAVAGLIVAGLYTLLVGVGVLVAPFSHAPWLLPTFTFAIPLVSLLLAWMGRARIQASEGVLGGLALTRWTVGLSICATLSYAAYYAATIMAVRQQADRFTQQWLGDIAKGQIEKAFWKSLPPPRPTTLTRDLLEHRYNRTDDFTKLQSYSGFSQSDYVRLVHLAGAEANWRLVTVNGWSWERGSYVVSLTYRIRTPLAEFRLHTLVEGTESPTREYQGRQWRVVLEKSGVLESDFTMTREGEMQRGRWQAAKDVAQSYLGFLRQHSLKFPFLLGKSAPERVRLDGVLDKNLEEAPGKSLTANEREQVNDFFKGKSVRPDKDGMWAASEADRQLALTEVQKLFARKADPVLIGVNIGRARIPLIEHDGKRLTLRYDFQLTKTRPEPDRPMLVEVRVVVVSSDNPDEPEGWHIEGLELVRTRRPPQERSNNRGGPPG